MAITSTDKLVTKEVLEYYQGKVDEKYIDTTEHAESIKDFITDEALEDYAKTEDVITKENMEEDLEDYAKTEDIEKAYVKKDGTKGLSDNNFSTEYKNQLDAIGTTYATKEEIKSFAESGLRYMGQVATEADLTEKEATAKKGDFWDVQADDINRVWNGTGWDKMAPKVDISGKADKTDFVAMTTAEVDAMMQG